MVRVPKFDLGLAPPFTKAEPRGDDANNRLTQRVPFDVTGSWGGCPVDGFAWSELLSNWYGWEERDPWANIGGRLPKTPKRCGARVRQPPLAKTGELNPPAEAVQPPSLNAEECQANDATPRCEFDAQGDGGIAGSRALAARSRSSSTATAAGRRIRAEPSARAITSSRRRSRDRR
jgi:hypothetical protein